MAMSPLNIDAAIDRIRSGGIIAIIRGTYQADQIRIIADILASAGLGAMEITLNSPGALDHIAMLREHGQDRLLIGAGTVRTAQQARQAIDAGAQFLISPGFDAESVKTALAAGVLHLPGVFTPTEAQQAAAAGCRMLKLFPADALGPTYLLSLRAPLDDVAFVPTGGVTAGNIPSWRQFGAVAVAAGSTLVTGPDQSPDDLTSRATAMRRAWEDAANL